MQAGKSNPEHLAHRQRNWRRWSPTKSRQWCRRFLRLFPGLRADWLAIQLIILGSVACQINFFFSSSPSSPSPNKPTFSEFFPVSWSMTGRKACPLFVFFLGGAMLLVVSKMRCAFSNSQKQTLRVQVSTTPHSWLGTTRLPVLFRQPACLQACS